MNLQEISAGNGELSAMVVRLMMERHPLIPKLQFYSMVGNADSLRKDSAATGGTVRSVGSNYSGSDVTPSFATPTLTIFGDEIRTDQAHERRGADIVSVRKSDLVAFANRAALSLVNYVVNGSGNTNQPTGIKTLTDSGQKFFANSSSAALALELGVTDGKKSVHQKVLELLQKGIEMVSGGAQCILLPSALHARITAIARDNLTWLPNEFGRPVPSFNGVELIPAGYTNTGTQIIAGDEQPGTINVNTYSIYFLRLGEKSDLTIATNSGLHVTDKGLVGASYVYNIDFDLELATTNAKAIAKLEGITLP